ncbi:MAG: transcription antitermination protein NusB, partial [Alphaproteobacteria bacterium]
ALIQGALDTRRLERMELVLQSILVAGAAELLAISEAPPKVTISEYVDIADDFFGKSEASLVNATLDRIGHLVRPDEF